MNDARSDTAVSPDRIAVCQHPGGPGEYVPAEHVRNGGCFMDCDCTPRVYIAEDAATGDVAWRRGYEAGRADAPTLFATVAAERERLAVEILRYLNGLHPNETLARKRLREVAESALNGSEDTDG